MGRARHAAAVYLRRRLLHGLAVARMEHQRGRRGAARGHAAGHHGDVDRMEQRAGGGTVHRRLCVCGLGGGWVFALAVLSAVVMMQVVRRWPPKPHAKSPLPAERLWSGTVAGLRYARYSPMILAQLLRNVAYSGAGSALWALLPAIAAQHV
jgi:hypothetical protein